MEWAGAKHFMIGFCGGTAVSIFCWCAGIKRLTRPGGDAVIIIIPAAKLGLGLVLLAVPRWRMIGAGVITSLAAGVLIFFTAMCGSTR
jgi:hypothetical protein